MREECKGCSHQAGQSGGFCYMFEQEPDELPCGQHDMFVELRKATGDLIKKNPQILDLMVLASM